MKPKGKLFQVDNMEEIQSRLNTLSKVAVTQALRKGVNVASTRIRKEVKVRIPKGKTGRLGRYLKKQAGEKYKVHWVRTDVGIMGSPTDKDFPYYGWMLEKGFKTVKTGRYANPLQKRLKDDTPGPPKIPKGRRPTISAGHKKPFLLPAFEASAEEAGQQGVKVIWDYLARAFKK